MYDNLAAYWAERILWFMPWIPATILVMVLRDIDSIGDMGMLDLILIVLAYYAFSLLVLGAAALCRRVRKE